MNTKTMLMALASALGMAANAAIGDITFPASLGTVDNDLNGQALGAVSVEGGNMTITGAAGSSLASLALAGDATTVTITDALKPTTVTAVAGVDDGTDTTYYTAWAAAVAAAGTDAAKTLEVRTTDALAYTLLAHNDRVKLDTGRVAASVTVGTSITDGKAIKDSFASNTDTLNTWIAKWDLSKATVVVADAGKYDGTEKTPDLTVTHSGGGTVAAAQYDVAWDGNTHAGDAAKVTLTGKDDYTERVEKPFSIARRSVTITSDSAEKTYDGTALVKESVTVTGDGFASGEGATYTYTGTQTHKGESANTFSYELTDATTAGDYDITTANGTLMVNSLALTYTADDQSMTYGGTVPQLTVSLTSGTKPNDGRSIAYTPATAATAASAKGEYAITLTGDATQFDGDYTLTFVGGTLTIGKRALADTMIAAIADQVYTGHALKPTPAVADGANAITADSDYTVSYEKNTLVSIDDYKAKVTITATEGGNYDGSASAEFVIGGAVAGEKVIALADDNALVYIPAGAAVTVAHAQTATVSGTGVIARAGAVRAEVAGALAKDATVSEGAATYLYGNQTDVDAIAALDAGKLTLADGVLKIRAQEDGVAAWSVTE